jgi:transposase
MAMAIRGFCCRFADHESRAKPTYRSRHVGGVAMECDYACHTIPIIDPSTGEIREAQIYVAVLSASQLTFSYASFSQKLPDWIEVNQRAFSYFGGVTKTTMPDYVLGHVIGHDQPGHATEEGEHAHVRADPIRERLGPGRLGERIARRAEHADEQFRLANLALRSTIGTLLPE